LVRNIYYCEVKSREDLAIAYTPGVAEPCKVIAENKEEAYRYTIKSNTVAVVSDGSAVLGLGWCGNIFQVNAAKSRGNIDYGFDNFFGILVKSL